jgi:two-component system CAI-1 autoinducer sensor kinase/phosphatase CqsS
MGLLGGIGYPLYYITWRYLFPQGYENLTLRLAMAVLLVPWIAHNHLPNKMRIFFPAYFFISSFVVVPFFFSFMTLKNQCSVVWLMTCIVGLFLLIMLVYNWVVICLMTIFGFLLAYVVIFVVDGSVSFSGFQSEYIPVYMFAVLGGIISNHQKQVANNLKISLMHSLGGSIAHEMRNPLSSIIHALGALRTFLPEKPPRDSIATTFPLSRASLLKLHETLEESTVNIQRGNKIIDSILSNMKGEQINLASLKRIGALDLVKTTLASYGFQDSSDRELIVIHNEQDFEFFADKDLCVYVLFNLLKNALYYKAGADFKIDIRIQVGQEHNLIKFKDNGVGIPANKLSKIFDSFYTAGKSGGTGLGLNFCRRVIESIGGSITCDSIEKKWTEFTIALPKYDSLIVKNLQKEILKDKQILLVDDLDVCRITAKKYLNEWHCKVEEAINGQQAIEKMCQKKYDLVLMDIEMPVLNGDQACMMIRNAPDIDKKISSHYEQIPIVAISTFPAETLRNIILQSGMSGFMEKPLSKIKVSELLDHYFFSEHIPKIHHKDSEMKGKRILLVDDNEMNRRLISIHLEYVGASVVQAKHGQEAIACLEQQDADIVLMDLEMPILDGLQATRLIREGQCFQRFKDYKMLPIIALTGNNDTDTLTAIADAGMNDHMSKPATGEQIIEIINTYLVTQQKRSVIKEPEPQHSWQDIEQASLLNIAVLNSLLEFDLLMVQDIFRSFLQNTTEYLQALSEAKKNMDIKAVSQISHALKGSAGNFGAYKLYLAAAWINDHARYNRWPSREEWLKDALEIFAQTNIALDVYIAERV